jgi:hypothetical protein
MPIERQVQELPQEVVFKRGMVMGDLSRIGISIVSELLSRFDVFIAK